MTEGVRQLTDVARYHAEGQIIDWSTQLRVISWENQRQKVTPFSTEDLPTFPDTDMSSDTTFSAFWRHYIAAEVNLAHVQHQKMGANPGSGKEELLAIVGSQQRQVLRRLVEWMDDEELVKNMSSLQKASCESLVEAATSFDWRENQSSLSQMNFLVGKIGENALFLETGEGTMGDFKALLQTTS